MKDFYWDIRPKPEYGTVEIRVFDTPLCVERAAALAIYAQGIARQILARPTLDMTEDAYLVYGFNRFQACRFGLRGETIDPLSRQRRNIGEEVRDTLASLRQQGRVEDEPAWREIARCLDAGNDAA